MIRIRWTRKDATITIVISGTVLLALVVLVRLLL
jgi:hypothetical protein